MYGAFSFLNPFCFKSNPYLSLTPYLNMFEVLAALSSNGTGPADDFRLPLYFGRSGPTCTHDLTNMHAPLSDGGMFNDHSHRASNSCVIRNHIHVTGTHLNNTNTSLFDVSWWYRAPLPESAAKTVESGGMCNLSFSSIFTVTQRVHCPKYLALYFSRYQYSYARTSSF